MNKICMRVDAYSEIGYGHLKRCLILADVLRAKNNEVLFHLVGDLVAAAEIKNAGFELTKISSKVNFSTQINFHDIDDFQHISIMILDLAHSEAIKDSKGLSLYLKEVMNRCFTVFIDSFGVQSARENIPELCCHILVSPYVGEQKSKKRVTYIELLGVDYFVLDPVYQHCKNKKIREVANKILITCGGTDPTSISIEILKALNSNAKNFLQIKVVVGAGFSSQLCETLSRLADCSSHDVSIIMSRNDLLAEMLWCDIAVATSGLTKYELAATGTPAILISIDSTHDTVNQYFIHKKSAIDLGNIKNVTREKLLNSVLMLLDNEDERKKQSLIGQDFIKGRGTNNFVDEILKINADNQLSVVKK